MELAEVLEGARNRFDKNVKSITQLLQNACNEYETAITAVQEQLEIDRQIHHKSLTVVWQEKRALEEELQQRRTKRPSTRSGIRIRTPVRSPTPSPRRRQKPHSLSPRPAARPKSAVSSLVLTLQPRRGRPPSRRATNQPSPQLSPKNAPTSRTTPAGSKNTACKQVVVPARKATAKKASSKKPSHRKTPSKVTRRPEKSDQVPCPKCGKVGSFGNMHRHMKEYCVMAVNSEERGRSDTRTASEGSDEELSSKGHTVFRDSMAVDDQHEEHASSPELSYRGKSIKEGNQYKMQSGPDNYIAESA